MKIVLLQSQYNKLVSEDEIKGGLSDKLTKNDIAKKFGIPVEKIDKELSMGADVEMEHVNSKDKALEIAMDHLSEIPDYYTRLKKMESGAKVDIKEGRGRLNEDMGVSRASIAYSNLMYNIIEPKIKELVETKKAGKQKIVIDYPEISRLRRASIDDFLEFPVDEIRIDLFFVKTKNDYPSTPYTVGGAAEQFDENSLRKSYFKKPNKNLPKKVLDEIDSTVSVKFEFTITFTNLLDESNLDDLLYEVRDTIVHECNHMYEFYNRELSGAGGVSTALSYSGSKNYNIPGDIFKIWNEFLYMIYYSEPYEMRAMVQEMYSVRLRVPFEQFKEHRYWKAADIMENFDADTMFDALVERIEQDSPDQVVQILTRLYQWFYNDYTSFVKSEKGVANKNVANSKHILDLMKRFQPRINNAGFKLKRKFNKLYSLDPE